MAILSKVTRFEHPGVLRDFNWPANLPRFGRYNLIYGWNGSGKTSFSRLLRHLEHRTVPSQGRATVAIRNRNVSSAEFASQDVHIRVFNRDFVDENVFPLAASDLPPIFVLGEENVEKQKAVEGLNQQRLNIAKKLETAKGRYNRSEAALSKYCADQAKAIKDKLRISGGTYNNYNKTNYVNQITNLIQAGGSSAHLLTEDTHSQLLKQHLATPKERVLPIDYSIPLLDVIHSSVAQKLGHTIVAVVIQELQKHKSLAGWVRDGLGLHREQATDACLFCTQTLPKSRVAELEAHFNAEYEELNQDIDRMIHHLSSLRDAANSIRPYDGAVFYDDLAPNYVAARSRLVRAIRAISDYLSLLIGLLERKRGSPFERIKSPESVPKMDSECISAVNDVIVQHNSRCSEFDERTNDARQRIALSMIADSIDEYVGLVDAVDNSRRGVELNERKGREILENVHRLEREIVEHRRPAEELNDDLKRYLGHGELRMDVRDTGYVLMRGDAVANSLSDGERTALALLYFLKTLDDRRFELANGVVVLDDPVSSLDSNALFLAFGYIRDRTHGAGQLFILTHNFSFFRQVRNWFHHLPRQNAKDEERRLGRLYMLSEVISPGPRRTTLQRLDPLLEHYESEYHYLFGCVYREANRASEGNLAGSYHLPNVARRLLEMFLAFRLPDIAGDLWKKLQSVSFDEPRKVRILRFVHTHSHGDIVGEPEHDPSLLGEAKAVLRDLLELVATEDPRHYGAMVSVVQRVNDIGVK